jgi:hypothetical protein
MKKQPKAEAAPLRPKLVAILNAFTAAGVGRPVTLDELRRFLPSGIAKQEELTRRLRDLRSHGYEIDYDKGAQTYTLRSATPTGRTAENSPISSRLAARVRLIAHGRCQMCGKTINQDGVRLVVDHRVPRHWGGASDDPDNLWAICEPCNIAKQAFFATLPVSVMTACMTPKQPIVRLGELLKAMEGRVVPRDLLEVVGRDDEWTRRLRELRDLGWDVTAVREVTPDGRRKFAYRLETGSWQPWPDDIEAAIAAAAKARKKQ